MQNTSVLLGKSVSAAHGNTDGKLNERSMKAFTAGNVSKPHSVSWNSDHAWGSGANRDRDRQKQVKWQSEVQRPWAVSLKDSDNPGMPMAEKWNVRGRHSHCLQMSEKLSVEEKIALLEDIRRSNTWK